jgi:hypothetical protein
MQSSACSPNQWIKSGRRVENKRHTNAHLSLNNNGHNPPLRHILCFHAVSTETIFLVPILVGPPSHAFVVKM